MAKLGQQAVSCKFTRTSFTLLVIFFLLAFIIALYIFIRSASLKCIDLYLRCRSSLF